MRRLVGGLLLVVALTGCASTRSWSYTPEPRSAIEPLANVSAGLSLTGSGATGPSFSSGLSLAPEGYYDPPRPTPTETSSEIPTLGFSNAPKGYYDPLKTAESSDDKLKRLALQFSIAQGVSDLKTAITGGRGPAAPPLRGRPMGAAMPYAPTVQRLSQALGGAGR